MPDRRTTPIPADDVGAELAVTRPRLPGHDLEELLNAAEIPLAAARGLDDQRLRAFTIEIARLGRITEAGRLAIGAALHRRRALAKRGEWTGLVAGLAEAAGVKTDTLGRWVLAAEKHYGLELTKGANPTRRGPLPGRRPAGLLASDPSNDHATGDAESATKGAIAPSEGAIAPANRATPARSEPVSPPDAEVCALHGSTRIGGCLACRSIHNPTTSPAKRDDLPAPGPKSPTTPPYRPSDTEAAADWEFGLGLFLMWPHAQQVRWIEGHLTQARAVHGQLGIGIGDVVLKRSGAAAAARTPAVEFDPDECTHPRDKRNVKPYATICDACGLRLS